LLAFSADIAFRWFGLLGAILDEMLIKRNMSVTNINEKARRHTSPDSHILHL